MPALKCSSPMPGLVQRRAGNPTREINVMSPSALSKEIEEMKSRIAHLEKVLIIGEGDRLPLAEIVRSLTKTVSDYIAQKDKEEQRQKEREEQKEIGKKAEWNRWKWLVIGIVVPGLLAFIGQAVYFYFRILPVVESLVP